jgi:hypothetical protein
LERATCARFSVAGKRYVQDLAAAMAQRGTRLRSIFRALAAA